MSARGKIVEVVGIAVLTDNYVWMMHDPASGETVVVDPAVAGPVLTAAEERGWRISQIWNSHWHDDHVGGNLDIKDATGCRIVAPHDPRNPIPGVDRLVGEGDQVRIGTVIGSVLSTPGHTGVHVSYHLPEISVVFTGDALFALGCGKLLEGTADDMYANMQRFAKLPLETAVYCAHEYTQANGRFALTVEPDNVRLVARMSSIAQARATGAATIPSTIGEELETNPFIRSANLAEFVKRRVAKDTFQ